MRTSKKYSTTITHTEYEVGAILLHALPTSVSIMADVVKKSIHLWHFLFVM